MVSRLRICHESRPDVIGLLQETSKPYHDDLRHESIMMAVDPSIVPFEERMAAGLANINGIDISDAPKIIDLGNRLIDYHADTAIEAIQAAIAGK